MRTQIQMKNSPQMLPSAMMAAGLEEQLHFARASTPVIDVSREVPDVPVGYMGLLPPFP
jgi:hypothetical protein